MATMEKSEKELDAFHQEWMDALQRLKEDALPFHELDYFFQTAQQSFSTEQLRREAPRVICLGAGVPEELIYAAGTAPCWAGDSLLRDADPVSRSMLGLPENDLWDLAKDALVLIPAVGDSSRKLAYLLERSGRKVLPIDFPPVKDRWGAEKWFWQWELCREALSGPCRLLGSPIYFPNYKIPFLIQDAGLHIRT